MELSEQKIGFSEQKIASSEQKIETMNATYQAEQADLRVKVAVMETNIQHQFQLTQQSINSLGHGSTYTRWGRSSCPAGTAELVYSGYTVSQHHYYDSKLTSGPTDVLCLPRDPNLSNKTHISAYSPLYGTEYETNYFAPDSQDNDVPCAVCRNKNTSSSIMIPGRQLCYSGWTNEYQGILASGNVAYKPSSYVCVDANPEYMVGGEGNTNGFLLYPVTTKCGPLPCPPYHDDVLVECVVCSK